MPQEIYNQILSSEKVLSKANLGKIIRNIWSAIYKKAFINENKILFNETPGAAYQDNGFFFYTATLAKSFYCIDENFYMYRQDRENSSVNRKDQAFAMNEELRLIEEFLNSHSEFKDKFYAYFVYFKFDTYLWTFNRISEEFKLEFLQRMQEEFRKIKQNFKLNTSYFNKKQKRNLELIMKDPCKFVSKARFKQSKLSQILRHPKKIFQILLKI